MSIRRLIVVSLFAALVTIATMVIKIPTVATQGYVNVGDTMIFVSALIMGPQAGLIAGGVGSALADILLGYLHWAPWTLVIKGIEGLIVGLLAYKTFQRTKKVSLTTIGATLIAAAWMVFGYYIAGGILMGFPAAVSSIPGNIVQGVASVILAIPLTHAFKNIKLPEE
jgi:uncharacterized membrane protein